MFTINYNNLKKYNQSSKSQIFMTDLILATVMIIVSLGIYFSYYYVMTPNDDLFAINSELSTTMSSLRINDLNNDYIRTLFQAQRIRNVDNSILQQISEFYEEGDLAEAQTLTTEIIDVYITQRIGFRITIIDESLNEEILSESSGYGSLDSASSVSTIERQVLGFYETNPYVHIYVFEVWQR